jgi:RNA polymerase sigma-70 factor (ECF subfamily)
MAVVSAEIGLVAGARAGDTVAFERLLGPWVTPGANLAFALLHDRHEAEDAVQEAAVKAWSKLHQLREGAAFGPWFLGIVAHECGSLRRSRWYRIPRGPLPEALAAPDERTADDDLRRAVARLNEKQRAAIVLHYYLDLPLDQVGQALGLSTAGVKSRLNRALKTLRPLLMAAEEDWADG